MDGRTRPLPELIDLVVDAPMLSGCICCGSDHHGVPRCKMVNMNETTPQPAGAQGRVCHPTGQIDLPRERLAAARAATSGAARDVGIGSRELHRTLRWASGTPLHQVVRQCVRLELLDSCFHFEIDREWLTSRHRTPVRCPRIRDQRLNSRDIQEVPPACLAMRAPIPKL